MLPQTRQKLRVFSLVCLIIGCLMLAGLWFSKEANPIIKGVKVPTFWELMLTNTDVHDEIEWKLFDFKMNTEDFANILRLVMILTVTASALSLVVVFQDIRLTKK